MGSQLSIVLNLHTYSFDQTTTFGGDKNIIIIIIFFYAVHHSLATTRNAILIIQYNDKTVNAQWI